jgi:hypothetical protein
VFKRYKVAAKQDHHQLQDVTENFSNTLLPSIFVSLLLYNFFFESFLSLFLTFFYNTNKGADNKRYIINGGD